MKRRSFLTATVLSAALSGFVGAPAVLAEEAGFYFVDLLHLNEGKSPADAAAYFELIEPVVAEHGLVRALPSFNVMTQMAGDLNADLMNVWTVSDPQSTFENIFNDDAYLAHVELRNSIFNMKESTMLMLTPNGS